MIKNSRTDSVREFFCSMIGQSYKYQSQPKKKTISSHCQKL